MNILGWEIKRGSPQITKKASRQSFRRAPRLLQFVIGRGGKISSNDRDTKFFIQRGYAQNPVSFSIANQIGRAASKAKWCVVNKKGEEVYVPLLNKPVGDMPSLLEMANPLEAWQEFIFTAIVHDVLEGNIFMQSEMIGDTNKPSSLSILPTDGMQIHGDASKKVIEAYTLDYDWGNGNEQSKIPAAQMLHIKEPNPDWERQDSLLFGQSVFEAAKIPIETYIESMEAGRWYLENKGTGKLVFNKAEHEIDLGIEGEDAEKESNRDRFQGIENTGNNINIIEGADLGVIDVASNPKEALVLEQRMQAATEIANCAAFPHSLLGLKDTTYQNGKEAKKGMWENCVIPRLDRIERGLSTFVAKKFGNEYSLKYKIDHIDALQEDRLMRGKALQSFAGSITVNEFRVMAGLHATDEAWGKELYVGFTQSVVDNKSTADGT